MSKYALHADIGVFLNLPDAWHIGCFLLKSLRSFYQTPSSRIEGMLLMAPVQLAPPRPGTVMSTSCSPSDTPPTRDGLVLPLFMITIFLSSLLVFSVQPLFTKMVLPLLGSSPGVWNTAMLFFQIMLLLGYIYAHLTTRLLGVRWQAWFHLSIMALIVLFLPIGVAEGWTPPMEEAPVPWLIGLFAVSVGLPFFAVATNAPLLQRWFSHTRHSAAADPYFLYGASNLGSMLALLSYPLFFEPLLSNHEQSLTWAWAYATLVVLIGFCALTLWRREATSRPSSTKPSAAHATSPTHSQRFQWLVLAFVPSSLLLGVTMHITTDVASIPLLWVLPLMLYLLTFVIVFARRPWLRHSWMVQAQPFGLILLALLFHWIYKQVLVSFLLHIVVFFVTTMVCHGELAKRRPPTIHLTEFYLWMSLGGMLGGVFNVMIAPVLFNSVFEYPLMLVIACLLRPCQTPTTPRLMMTDVLWPFGLFTILSLPLWWMGSQPADWGTIGIVAFFLIMGLGMYSFRHRPVQFSLGIAAGLVLTSLLGTQDPVLTRERSFFGVNTVQQTSDGQFNLLVHGNTIHGAQHTDPSRWKEPLTYFHQNGPLGHFFQLLNRSKEVDQVGVIGLGTGTLACFRQPGQHWTYYEIDPSVVRLAQDTRYFHYLDECGDDTEIVFGDGRLSLAIVQDKHFDLLVIDAFSSDTVPMHLITREALALYLRTLADGGQIAFNISNRNLEFSGVMGNLARDARLVGRIQQQRDVSQDEQAQFHFPSYWAVMARTSDDLAFLDADPGWQPLTPDPRTQVWTDDFSNVLGTLKAFDR